MLLVSVRVVGNPHSANYTFIYLIQTMANLNSKPPDDIEQEITRALSQELSDILSETIRKEIDAEVLFETFVALGWFPVRDVVLRLNGTFVHASTRTQNRPYNIDEIEKIENPMDEWIKNNIKCNYKQHGRNYAFEKESDALLFALKWK